MATAASDSLFGHPRGLYVCFLTEMWERFAFYGMKAILFLYLTKHHLFADADSNLLLGTYAGIAYALPLLGGLLADRYLGMRKAVLFGGALLALGQLGMAWIGTPATGLPGAAQRDGTALQVMYLSLALIGVGVGFLKPNISTIVGRLYRPDDPRRESGFTIFYMGINVGATLSSLIVAWIGETIGWGWGFGLSGVMMVLGLLQFAWGQKYLNGLAEAPDPVVLRTPVWIGLSREAWIYVGAVLLALLVWQMLQIRIGFAPLTALLGGHEATLTEVVAVVFGLALYVWFFWLLRSGLSRAEKGRMTLLILLTTVSALFWGLYEQTYGPWVTMADRVMDRSTFGLEWTAGQTTNFGALFVILFSLPFAWLWPRLDRRGLNPGYAVKFGLALLCCGLSFGVLAYAALHPGAGGLVSLWWMILAYAVLVLGEMLLSPVGLSAVTHLAIPRAVGLMMGAWFLFSAFGEIIAGRLGTWAAMEPLPDGSYDRGAALALYADVFGTMMWLGVAAGVALLLASPLLKRLTR